MVRFGGHLSTGGLLLEAFKQAQELEFNCFQTFIGPTTGWWPNKYSFDTAYQFRQLRERSGMPVAAHSNYYINLCNDDKNDKKRQMSIRSVVTQLDACDALGIDYLVVHPGSNMGIGDRRGFDLMVESCKNIMAQMLVKKESKVTLLLENTAGGGSTMGKLDFVCEALTKIKRSTEVDENHIGLCLDTTHAWAEGYDMPDSKDREYVLGVAKDHLKWVHFNMPDPKVHMGSHRDRHEVSWMEGKWPAEVMRDLYNEFQELNVPLCMEADPAHYPTNTMLLEEWGLR